MYSKLGIKITNEQLDERIKNSSFTRIGEYVNSKTSILFKCKKCGKLFKKPPKEFYRLSCKCEKHLKNYNLILEEKGTELLEPYFNCRTKLLHRCKICNNTFKTSPKVLKNSIYGCPFCAGTKVDQKDYINKLPSDIKLTGIYINSYTKTEHQCLVCNFLWETKPYYIINRNCGCPNCSSSKGERMIKNFLDTINITYLREYIVKINNIDYRFDFFIPEINTIIEFDGIQHFEPIDFFGGDDAFLKNKINDVIKTNWCLENNIKLVRIPYYEDTILFLEKKFKL